MANTIGWGQGSANNTNQWGRGATNNSISWGSIYNLSPSGETNIIGGLQPTFELKYDLITTDFTFTRASFGTRVNEFGLIETVTDLGADVVQNGDFEELGSELVTNGDFENGTTDWSFGGDWTLVNGTAEILTSTNSFLTQSNIIPLTVKTYKLEYEVVTTNGSNFRLAGGNSAFGTVTLDSATVGVKTVYLTSNGTKRNLQFNQNAFRGSIDNVSVKQVDPNDYWNIEDVWTIQDGVASGNGASGSSEELNQNISSSGILIGSTVRCSFEIKNYVSGSVQVIGISNSVSRLSNGIYEFQGDITSFNIRFRGSAFYGDVTNLSIQEVLEDDVPRIDYTTGEAAFLLEPQSTNLITYSEDFNDVSWINAGSPTITPNYGVSPDGTQNSTRIQGNSSVLISTNAMTGALSGETRSIYVRATSGSGNIQLTSHKNNTNNIFSINETWQRVQTNSLTSGSASTYFSIDMRGASTNIYDIEVWGAQGEALSYATSYIPTNGTTVTRAQESSVKNNVNGLFDDNVGSIYLAYDGVLTSGTTLNNMNPFRLYGQGSNRIRLYYTLDADFLGSSVDFENGGKIAWSCNGTTILTYINGALVDTHTITSNFTTLTNFILSTPFMTHRINDIKIYDKALTDDELINLTTI